MGSQSILDFDGLTLRITRGASQVAERRRVHAVLGRPFQIVNCIDPRNTIAISTAPALRR